MYSFRNEIAKNRFHSIAVTTPVRNSPRFAVNMPRNISRDALMRMPPHDSGEPGRSFAVS